MLFLSGASHISSNGRHVVLSGLKEHLSTNPDSFKKADSSFDVGLSNGFLKVTGSCCWTVRWIISNLRGDPSVTIEAQYGPLLGNWYLSNARPSREPGVRGKFAAKLVLLEYLLTHHNFGHCVTHYGKRLFEWEEDYFSNNLRIFPYLG